ncbi:hypothetical protein B0H17DRAFT_1053583 [Mycena rosella]|uniref:Secreted protein n=1 Tax=Mycena rosella TaxID=1033263 RepID=A0AAD7DPA7_MYCRO|nr:hypothetical protein B0H17DRAFT_1053583 [Mycena rosella]
MCLLLVCLRWSRSFGWIVALDSYHQWVICARRSVPPRRSCARIIVIKREPRKQLVRTFNIVLFQRQCIFLRRTQREKKRESGRPPEKNSMPTMIPYVDGRISQPLMGGIRH